MEKNDQGGFSLIELLIVVTIIGIIASIAVPNLLASRRAANEASAQSSLRVIASCEETYRHYLGTDTYGNLSALGAQVLTDSVLAGGNKSGYIFTVNPAASGTPQYWAYALPTSTTGVGATGNRRFAISEDGVLRGDTTLTPPADENAVRAMPALGN